MKAHKISVTIPEDHELEIRLPEDFPAGPAEVIVLANPSENQEIGDSRQQMLKAMQKLKSIQRTPEEGRILDDFEEFRRQHSR